MYEIFAKLLEEKGVTAYQVYKATGVAQSSLSDWKNGKSKPKYDKMQKIADYFGVTIDYLLTGEQKEKSAPVKDKDGLTEKDFKDIGVTIDKILGELDGGNDALMFHGEPLNDETRALIRAALEVGVKSSKILAKEKFTPKKYKKENN